MPHVVLLGDSIFDNAAYVAGGPDVLTQLRDAMPDHWAATSCAVDGAMVGDVGDQLARIPSDATHLVLSAGGNDALMYLDLLHRPAHSFPEVLDALAAIGDEFEQRYRKMLARILAIDLPVVICTIYNGWLPEPELRRRARAGLIAFNDVILRCAWAERLEVIELRHVCNEPEDFANPIEPSVRGGGKIARAIRDTMTMGSHPAIEPML